MCVVFILRVCVILAIFTANPANCCNYKVMFKFLDQPLYACVVLCGSMIPP